MPCFKGPNKRSLWQRTQDMAVRMGLMEDSDRVADVPLSSETEAALLAANDQSNYGKSIQEILSRRQEIEDDLLVGHLCGLLMEKESASGMDGLSDPERVFYLVGDMMRQLDSGGFNTYFYNTGHLAHMLLPALEQIQSVEAKAIATAAMAKYGKVPSANHDEMLAELSDLTQEFENNPWETEDDQYFELEEHLAALLMDYAGKHTGDFAL